MAHPTFGWIVHLVARNGEPAEALFPDNCRYIERLDKAFTTLWFEDHFHKGGSPLLECWTTLTYMAAHFPNMKVGSLVLCQSYRNPGLLAKMMATLQVLTAGRYIAGIGAGWKEDEYAAYGYDFPSGRVRVEQLEEVVQILRAMWASSPATFEGNHHSVRQAECEPLPHPSPPLLIGGGGEKHTLRVVAKYADWMNVTFADAAMYSRKLMALREHCDQVGRDYASITKSLWAYVHLTEEGAPPAPSAETRYILHGTPNQVRSELSRFADLGVEHFMLRFIDFPSPRGLDLFQAEVLPRL
jgi:alkanesulfonate monooxygenase SsuD/methylene tetrahydromethanopterin reductase-like flavin-dependent oxidoreductase (luciferase family)